MDIEHAEIRASDAGPSSWWFSERMASPVLRCKMAKVTTNAAYRKSRGTDKPFTGSDEQANAIWIESMRREKWHPAKAAPQANPAPKPAK